MAYVPATVANRARVFTEAPQKPSLFQRLIRAMMLSRQRQAEREIARYLQSCGRLTDDIEREIERRFLNRQP